MLGSSRENEGGMARGFGLGLLVGAVIGAGAAILFAPASGVETRRRLRKEARRAYVRGSDAVEDLWEDGERRAKNLVRRVRETV